MSSEFARSVSIDPECLIEKYEAARRLAGIGDRQWRLTTGQHLDVHRLIAALRGKGGKAESGARLETWVDYLAPIIAESGPARDILRDVLVELTGADRDQDPTGPNVKSEAQSALDGEVKKPKLTLFRRVAEVASNAVSGLIVAGLLLGALTYKYVLPDTTPLPFSGPRRTVEPTPPIKPEEAADVAKRRYQELWDATQGALADPAFRKKGITPRLIAAFHAGQDPRLGPPDVLLANMLRAWPVSPDDELDVWQDGSLAQSSKFPKPDRGADRDLATLQRLVAIIASIRYELPGVLFEGVEGRPLTPSVSLLPTESSSLVPVEQSAVPWSKLWLLIAGIPMIVYIAFAGARYRKDVRRLSNFWVADERRAKRREALQGLKRKGSLPLTRLPQPFVERKSFRTLMRYKPIAGRKLDAPRSIAALTRQEGIADLVMRRVQRAVSYLVIVQRRQPHDHERLRIRRLFARLADLGLPVFVYDYDRDPLLLKRSIAADPGERAMGINQREETLALSTLRDLHSDARLILMTDGRDLVERIRGRVRSDIVKTLSFWKERMVLTPVPVGDWGEVELALSRDLDAPLGRTDESALLDLARGFQTEVELPIHRIALSRAASVAGAGRLDAWWQTMREQFGNAANESRGSAISFDKRTLTTDLSPSRVVIAAILQDLHRWLGARGFLWHAACAIYPQLRYDLTLYIGSVLPAGAGENIPALFRDTPEDRRVLDRMTSLPWFRAGRMPEWLRKEMLQAISADDRERAATVIRDLFKSDAGAGGSLTLWWPQAGTLAMPPDAVMADALIGISDGPVAVAPDRAAELGSLAARRVLIHEIGDALTVGAACIGLWYFAPDFETSPHGPGAWFPLVAFAIACLGILGFVVSVRRRQKSLTREAVEPASQTRLEGASAGPGEMARQRELVDDQLR